MSVYRRLITFFAAIIIVLFIVGFALPKKIEFENSITINAPVDSVFVKIADMNHFSNWLPWTNYDKDVNVSLTGEKFAVGSGYSWEGNELVGKGSMSVTNIEHNKHVYIKMVLISPNSLKADTYFNLEDKNGKTSVTWGYIQKMAVPKNVFALFFGLKKSLSGEFEKSLQEFRKYCEK